MGHRDEYDFFNYDRCTLCGECLYRCQYMDLTREEAVEEKKRLLTGDPSPELLRKCISCYACNSFCPNDCKPYELIIAAWYRRYREHGLPVRARYLMPSTFPNFRTDMVRRMSHREQALVRTWRETPPEGELVLYPGCNIMAMPHLLDAPFMQDIRVAGDWELCCGEMFFRMGLFNEAERTAEKLTAYYRGRDIGTMLFACPACMNMFANVLPDQFGAEFNFEKKFLGIHLLEKIRSGELAITGKLNRTVTLHDSCHARVLGDVVMDNAREILAYLGIDILEMEHNRREGFCCGAAAGANKYSPFDILFTGIRELREGKRTGADDFALYCGGCNVTLNICSWLYPSRQPVRHLLEYLKEATGAGTFRPAQRRSFFMLLNILFKCFPLYLSTRTFRVGEDRLHSKGVTLDV